MPGVTVTGKNAETGFIRTDVSDAEGVYRLTGLPVGTYDVRPSSQGFSKFEQQGARRQRRPDRRHRHRR